MGTKERVLLIVDDEEDLREILSYSFQKKGYKTFQAANAVEAIEIVKQNKVDAIISDMRMPGGDGVQLLEEVKKYNANIPTVLFITGFTDITLEEAYDKGCEAIFAKPFDPKVLIAAVEKLTQSKEEGGPRRATRVDSAFKIDIKHKNYPEARQSQVLNIGRGGFFIRMTENFPNVGDSLNFRIIFDQEVVSIIEGEGVVKWVRREQMGDLLSGCGVEFSSLDEKTRAKIFELINFLKTTQYIPKS